MLSKSLITGIIIVVFLCPSVALCSHEKSDSPMVDVGWRFPTGKANDPATPYIGAGWKFFNFEGHAQTSFGGVIEAGYLALPERNGKCLMRAELMGGFTYLQVGLTTSNIFDTVNQQISIGYRFELLLPKIGSIGHYEKEYLTLVPYFINDFPISEPNPRNHPCYQTGISFLFRFK